MKTIIRNTVLSLAVAATALSVVPAQANDHWRRHRSNDNALAAGIAGLAVGAIVGGLVSQPYNNGRVYYDEPRYRPVPSYPAYPAYPVYQTPQPIYQAPRYDYRPTYRYAGMEPWTPSWYRACSARYRSFNPSSGTFTGYDGQRHFCTLN